MQLVQNTVRDKMLPGRQPNKIIYFIAAAQTSRYDVVPFVVRV
jgi:hypothetical protein